MSESNYGHPGNEGGESKPSSYSSLLETSSSQLAFLVRHGSGYCGYHGLCDERQSRVAAQRPDASAAARPARAIRKLTGKSHMDNQGAVVSVRGGVVDVQFEGICRRSTGYCVPGQRGRSSSKCWSN